MAGKRGGARPGAGRPKGSTNRPTIFDYWDENAIAEYFEFLRDNYKEDSRLMVFVGEHLMGKAPQSIEANVNGSITLTFDPTFNATASTPARGRKV